ncbi:O-antigen ligase family protein [Sphingomonas sp. 1P06PA]|uniref:O-antigen ligase family protein n=1 Tax=Sphingomonas sp. 1P06PA TaxID=554121 RepID=UPI0039A5D548
MSASFALPDRRTPRGLDAWIASALAAAALLLGGQGMYLTLVEAVPQAIGLGILIYLVAGRGMDVPAGAVWPVLIALLLLCVPLVQLMPLPETIWQTLPGRSFAREISTVAGVAGRRMLSLDPDGTRDAAIQLIPAVAMFLLALRLDRRGRLLLVSVVICVAAFSMLVGVLQVAGGAGSRLYLYPTLHAGLSVGLFANRNHQADLALIGLVLTAALLADAAGRGTATMRVRTLAGGLALLFAASLVATASRTGFALGLPVAVIGLLMLATSREISRRTLIILLVGGVVAGAGLILAGGGAFARLGSRFGATTDMRFVYWADSWFAIQQYWPFGSGLGTFDPAYRAIEDLSNVTPFYANAAHNDYLQLLLEVGIVAPILFTLFSVWLMVAAWRVWREERDMVRIGALAGMLVLLAHSFTDYPLRTVALSTMFGMLAALLLPPMPGGELGDTRRRRRRSAA